MNREPTLITRRSFLRTGLVGGSLAWSVPSFLHATMQTLQAATQANPAKGRDRARPAGPRRAPARRRQRRPQHRGAARQRRLSPRPPRARHRQGRTRCASTTASPSTPPSAASSRSSTKAASPSSTASATPTPTARTFAPWRSGTPRPTPTNPPSTDGSGATSTTSARARTPPSASPSAPRLRRPFLCGSAKGVCFVDPGRFRVLDPSMQDDDDHAMMAA
jgi:hypothetical protein